MSNPPAPRPTTYPAHPLTSATPAYRPVGADRPTATFPTGWQACPSAYVHEGDPRLAQADATPTAAFPTRRPQPRHEGARPASGPAADAASLSHGGAGAHAIYPAAQPAPSRAEQEHEGAGPVQDMWRPGPLSRPSMRWHPSLMQLAIGAALVFALLGACNVAAINAHRDARAYCHALVVSDWQAATRECRGTGSGTPVPEQLPSSPHTPSESPSQAPSPSTPPALTRVTSPSPSTQPSPATQVASSWVTQDTRAPYDRTDASASPLDLPRCTTAPDTPLPCLAHAGADGSHAVVLEEDGSMSGLVRR